MSEIASSPKLSKKELEPYFNPYLVRSKLHSPTAINLPLSLYFSSRGILRGASLPLILSWPKRLNLLFPNGVDLKSSKIASGYFSTSKNLLLSSHQRALLYIAWIQYLG